MADKKEENKAKEQEILGPTYEPGKPEYHLEWRTKFTDRAQKMKYLETGERYWYSADWYGSEKRKKPA